LKAERWERLQRLLREAEPLGPEERAALLARECAGDEDLRRDVGELLDSAAEAEGYFSDLAGRLGVRVPAWEEAETALEGRLLGAYRLIELIARGGMGAVYLAERADGQFEKQVAVKLLPLGMDSGEARRRFMAERQLLAGLEHPNISRLLDGGIAEDGTPYFVMEWVDGLPIDRHCEQENLGLRDRLVLFESVCRAVQYAHQNLVVHRDLKPSNVMVTPNGGVRLLDFGIAKLLSDDPGLVPPTGTGARLMTPRFAAPEQVRGGPITTATDVYALGVLLYLLLTGRSPYRTDSERPPDVERAILEEQPVRPSAAVKGADVRGSTTEAQRRRLRGDLDNILLKALEKDPLKRYQSAQQLLDDLERHRRGLPVEARPYTVGYRVRKFMRRHRAGLAGALAIFLLLAGFAVFHSLRITGARDAARAEAAKARASTQFLQRLLGDAYPSVALGDTFSMSDLLERATARVDSLADQPDVQAELLRTLGDVYRAQGYYEKARPLLERAVDLHRVSGDRTRAEGEALGALGELYYEAREYEMALETTREELEVARDLFAPDDSAVLFAMNNLAAAATALDRREEAQALHREVLERHGRLFADTSQLVQVTHNNLGELYYHMGDFAAAEREFGEVLRIRRMILPSDHPSLALSLNNVGNVLRRQNRLDEAEPLLREALDIWLRVLGPNHTRVGIAAYNLARVLEMTGDLDEADSLYRATAAIDRLAYGDAHLEVGNDLSHLGGLQATKGDCAGAVSTLREADDIFETNGLELSDRRRLAVRGNLGSCLATLGRFDEGEGVLLGSYDAARNTEDAGEATRELAERLAALYDTSGRSSEAEALRSSLAIEAP